MKQFVIALAIAATASLALADHDGAYGRHRGGDRMEAFAQKLGLSDAQKQQIADIRKADFEKNKQLYTDFRSKMREYRQLKQANDARADAVKSELDALKPQVKAAREAAHQQILTVLTPEQRQQFEQWKSEHKQRN
jgi:Spy/CpxP family protein refolding chaperone